MKNIHTVTLTREELLAIRDAVFQELANVEKLVAAFRGPPAVSLDVSSTLEAALQSAMAKLIVAIHEHDEEQKK